MSLPIHRFPHMCGMSLGSCRADAAPHTCPDASHVHTSSHTCPHMSTLLWKQRGMPSSMCTSTAMRHALSAREGTKATSSLSDSDLSFDLCRPSIPGASSHERDAFASSTHDQQGSLPRHGLSNSQVRSSGACLVYALCWRRQVDARRTRPAASMLAERARPCCQSRRVVVTLGVAVRRERRRERRRVSVADSVMATSLRPDRPTA